MTHIYEDYEALTKRIIEAHDDDGLGAAAQACIDSLDWFASASHPAAVRLLIALLCTSMDSEIGQAVSAVKEHNPEAWQECIGFVLTHYTLGYFHEQLQEEIFAAAVEVIGRPDDVTWDALPPRVRDRLDPGSNEHTLGAGQPPTTGSFAIVLPGEPGATVVPSSPRYRHQFRSTDVGEALFAHRDPGLWLEDLLRGAGFTDFEVCDADLHRGTLRLTVEGPPQVLTFCCVLLNQHAGQSPSDATPDDEALLLERTLSGPPIDPTQPRCPSCGARRWQVDCDLRNRAAVMVGEHAEVCVDRAGPNDSMVIVVGHVACQECAHMLSEGDPLYDVVTEQAGAIVSDESEAPWRVITDYRQF